MFMRIGDKKLAIALLSFVIALFSLGSNTPAHAGDDINSLKAALAVVMEKIPVAENNLKNAEFNLANLQTAIVELAAKIKSNNDGLGGQFTSDKLAEMSAYLSALQDKSNYYIGQVSQWSTELKTLLAQQVQILNQIKAMSGASAESPICASYFEKASGHFSLILNNIQALNTHDLNYWYVVAEKKGFNNVLVTPTIARNVLMTRLLELKSELASAYNFYLVSEYLSTCKVQPDGTATVNKVQGLYDLVATQMSTSLTEQEKNLQAIIMKFNLDGHLVENVQCKAMAASVNDAISRADQSLVNNHINDYFYWRDFANAKFPAFSANAEILRQIMMQPVLTANAELSDVNGAYLLGAIQSACQSDSSGQSIVSTAISSHTAAANRIAQAMTQQMALYQQLVQKFGFTSRNTTVECQETGNYYVRLGSNISEQISQQRAMISNYSSLTAWIKANGLTNWGDTINFYWQKVHSGLASQINEGMTSLAQNGKLNYLCSTVDIGPAVISKVDSYYGASGALNSAIQDLAVYVKETLNNYSSQDFPNNNSSQTCINQVKATTLDLSKIKKQIIGVSNIAKTLATVESSGMNETINSANDTLKNVEKNLGIWKMKLPIYFKNEPKCSQYKVLSSTVEDLLDLLNNTKSELALSVSSIKNNTDIPIQDGVEEDAAFDLVVKKDSSGRFVFSASSSSYSTEVILKATKRGAKTITFKVQTSDDGSFIFKTNRNLKGFLLTSFIDGAKIDSRKI